MIALSDETNLKFIELRTGRTWQSRISNRSNLAKSNFEPVELQKSRTGLEYVRVRPNTTVNTQFGCLRSTNMHKTASEASRGPKDRVLRNQT